MSETLPAEDFINRQTPVRQIPRKSKEGKQQIRYEYIKTTSQLFIDCSVQC